MKNFTFTFLITFIFMAGCVYHPNVRSSKKSSLEQFEPYKIAFVSLKISKKENDYSISIENSKIIEGSVKSVDPKPENYTENDFLCFVQDKNKIIMDTLIIVQPLNPRYEFPKESGEIGSLKVDLPENSVMIRFRYQTNLKYIRIDKVEKDKSLRTLETFEIPMKE